MKLLPSYIHLFLLLTITLSSCSALPQLYNTIDDIADNAIKIEVDKAALQKDSDVIITVTLVNNKATPVVMK